MVSIDNNNKILTNARENNKRFKSKVEFKEADAFHLDFPDNNFDIAFSQGFFEHFSDFDINLLLKEQLRVAKKVIFSVPTFYYRNRDFGNERLLLKRHWRDILKDFNVTDDGYYLYTRRRKNLLLELPMMYMATVER